MHHVTTLDPEAREKVRQRLHGELCELVREKGFIDAMVERFDDMVHAFQSGVFDEKNLGGLVHEWLMLDNEARGLLEGLDGEKAEILERFRRGETPPAEDDERSVTLGGFFRNLRQAFERFAFDHESISEADGSPVKCLQDALFQNWGRTVENCPALTCLPTTKQGICNIVKWAKKRNKTVRVAGYRHTWSDLYSNKGQVLISMLPLDVVTKLPAEEPLLNPHNELMGIEMVGTVEVDGQTKGLCKIGAATTNEMFRRWAIGTMAWTVPLNVIMVEISYGGSNAPICHGAGIRHETLSDLVHSIEFVNANGELQVVDDRDQLKAAAGCFGMLGVVTSITLALDPMTIANMRPQKVPAMLAIPPLPGTPVPDELQINPTQEQLDQARAQFVDAATNDFYAEWFWFAFQDKVWANTWKDDGTFEDAKDYPGPGAVFLQSAGTYIANILNQTVFRLLPGRWQAKFLTTTAMLVLPEVKDGEDPIATPVIDALHFQRGIQNMRVLDMEFEIPLPADATGQPDWSVCQRAWWDVINLVYSLDRTPMRLTLEMRVMGGSSITMAPQYGNDLGTCSIEVLTPLNVSERRWQQFMQDVADLWASYTDTDGNPLLLRPHWAKQWQGLKIRDKDIVDYLKEDAYGDRIPEFKAGLEAVATAGGYALDDLKMFTNPLLSEIFAGVFA